MVMGERQGLGPTVDRGEWSDLQHPNTARMYDYYLGGSANFAIDRDTADEAVASMPGVVDYVRASRLFMQRVVRYLWMLGIDQFLDLGSGIPTMGNVHEIVHRHDPHARVAYVDVDMTVVAHARRLLGADGRVSFTRGDLREPETVLAAPGVAGFLDLSRPVAVLAISVLPQIRDDENPAGLMAAYREWCVPGSYLAVSHGSPVTITEEQTRRGGAVYRDTSTLLSWRTRAEIARFLPGYELVAPGLVLLGDWQPDPAEIAPPENTNGYGALGVLPGSNPRRNHPGRDGF